METPGNFYLCLTCGAWQILNWLEAGMAQSSTMKPVCRSCDTIMYNVAANDGLQLREEAEPEPLSK